MSSLHLCAGGPFPEHWRVTLLKHRCMPKVLGSSPHPTALGSWSLNAQDSSLLWWPPSGMCVLFNFSQLPFGISFRQQLWGPFVSNTHITCLCFLAFLLVFPALLKWAIYTLIFCLRFCFGGKPAKAVTFHIHYHIWCLKRPCKIMN